MIRTAKSAKQSSAGAQQLSSIKEKDLFAWIDGATEGTVMPNEALNEQIVNAVKEMYDPKELYEVVRRIRKKLKATQHTTVMNALNLIETMMTRCHSDFHLAMGDRKMINQMVKVVKSGKSRDPLKKEQAEKALHLISKWGKEFEGQLAIGRVFVETYQALLKKGKYSFPDAKYAVVEKKASKQQPQLTGATSEQRKELVENVTAMLHDLLENVSSKEDLENEIIQQLVKDCVSFQQEIATLGGIENEVQVAELFELNEQIVHVLEEHATAQSQASKATSAATQKVTKKNGVNANPAPSSDEPSLIDFSDNGAWDNTVGSSSSNARPHASSVNSFAGWSVSSNDAHDEVYPSSIAMNFHTHGASNRRSSEVSVSSIGSFSPSFMDNGEDFNFRSPNSENWQVGTPSISGASPYVGSSPIPGSYPKWEEPLPAPLSPFQGPIAPGWGGKPPMIPELPVAYQQQQKQSMHQQQYNQQNQPQQQQYNQQNQHQQQQYNQQPQQQFQQGYPQQAPNTMYSNQTPLPQQLPFPAVRTVDSGTWSTSSSGQAPVSSSQRNNAFQ